MNVSRSECCSVGEDGAGEIAYMAMTVGGDFGLCTSAERRRLRQAGPEAGVALSTMLTAFTETGTSTSGGAPPDGRPGARSPGKATQNTHRPPCSKRKHLPVPKELHQTFLGLLFPTY